MSGATATATPKADRGHDGRPLLTTRELALRLRVSRTTAQQLMYSGAIRSHKINKSRRVSEEAVAEYLELVTAK